MAFGIIFEANQAIPINAYALKKRSLNMVLVLMLLLVGNSLSGQFYNGLQMTFGKNKIQYYDFYWSYYRFDNFDCYFNEYGNELAQYTSWYAQKRIEEIEDYFDYMLEKRLILIVYNKQAEFRQSNIGLNSDLEDYNIGGQSRTIKNKVMLYYEGDHESYENQISASITEVIIDEMLYDAENHDRVSGSSEVQLPDWYLKGLINYIAFGWNEEAENRVRDGFMSGKYKRLDFLEYEDAVYAGQSFWKYVADTYGEQIIPNVIYLTKIYKNVREGLMYVLGLPLKDLEKEWLEYYKNYFENIDSGNDPGPGATLIAQAKKRKVIQEAKLSPDQKYLAWVTYDNGKRKIFIHDNQTDKTKKIFSIEPKFEQNADNTYPVLAWHPGSDILTFINEEKNALKIYFYRISTDKTESRNLLYFDKVLDFNYSNSGNRLVMSAVKDGVTDIYIHTIASATNEQITRDVADDLNPRYLKGSGNKIIFSSNRMNDTIPADFDPLERTNRVFDLFIYDLDRDNRVLTRLAESDYANRFEGQENASGDILYLGNQNGTINSYMATFDSTISYIDTTTHYRYFINSRPLTNYNTDVLGYDEAPGGMSASLFYKEGKYKLYTMDTGSREAVSEEDMIVSGFRKEQLKVYNEADSIEKLREWLIEEDRRRRDTLTKPLYEYYSTDEPIDINFYIFEKEKQNYYEQQWRKDYMDIDLDTARTNFPLIRIYETSFYNNFTANQLDFTYLNNSYQPYSGTAPYFNPGVNYMTKFGIVDLFENYRLTGGVRLSFNFDSNEYLLSFENLRKKTDKQIIYHRQSLNGYNDTAYFKITSNNFYYTLSRPFTEVMAIKGTLIFRNQRYVPQSLDFTSLNSKMFTRNWIGLNTKLVYDNTRPRGTNIYFGTRFMIFGEYYRDLQIKKSDMFVVGADFRHYLRIHRDLIWANRIAGSSSWGPSKLLYYLGGVDNWMGFLFTKTPMFDQSVPVSPTTRYAFQTLATNMRGFSQNVRNGNNFMVINSEIRWPVVKYIVGHPLKSSFLNDFQVVLFGDVGTAWTGLTPWSGQNEYDTETYRNGVVVVTLDTHRQPIVEGFGFGLRANLFGYFVRADWAWGIENSVILPNIFYLSFSLDF